VLKTTGPSLLVLVLLLLCGSAQAMEKQAPTIAIIIDDLGLDRKAAQRLIDLEPLSPWPFSLTAPTPGRWRMRPTGTARR